MPLGRRFFSMMLIVCAGLFVRALQRAGSMNPGFDPHGVELVSLDVKMAGYTNTTGRRFARELVDRVRQLPGVARPPRQPASTRWKRSDMS